MKKLIGLTLLASISAYATPNLDGTKFGSESAYIATPYIPTINEEISIYKSKNKDLFFYKPQFNININELKNSFLYSQQGLPENNKDKNIEINIEFPIYLYSQDVENDIVYSLNNNTRLIQELSRGSNIITKISTSDVSLTPYNLLIIYALIDGKKIPVYANPRLEDIEGDTPISTQENTKSRVFANLTGTLSTIKKFSENPKFIGEVYYRNLNTIKVVATANISNVIKSNSFNKLFGDENEKKEHIVRSKSNGGGWGVNLGFVKFGGTKGDTQVTTSDKHKRWISKNLLSDMLENYFLSVDFKSYCSEVSKDCNQVRNTVLKQLLPKIIDNSSKVTAEFKHVKDNQYALINTVTEKSLGSIVNIDETVKSKPDNKLEASEDTAVSVGKDVGASRNSTLNLTNKDEIEWTQKGGKWIPTKIDLYLVNKSELKNSAMIKVTQIIAKNRNMQRLMLTPVSLKKKPTKKWVGNKYSSTHLKIGNISISIDSSRKMLTKVDTSTGKTIGNQAFKTFYGMVWIPEKKVLLVSGILRGGNSPLVLKIKKLGGTGTNMFATKPSGASVNGYKYIIGSQNLRVSHMEYNKHLMLTTISGKKYHMNGTCGTGSNMCALVNANKCMSLPNYGYFKFCE